MNLSIPSTETASTAHLAASPVHATARAGNLAALKYLLVYEDSRTGLRARQIMNQLGEGGGGMVYKPVLFRFELLQRREIWELAAQESQTVDVLVLCAHEGGGVPMEVKSWVTYWLGLKGGRPRKVVVSFDAAVQPVSGAEQTLFFFRSLAAWADMELTVLFGEGPHAALNQALSGVSARAEKEPAPLARFILCQELEFYAGVEELAVQTLEAGIDDMMKDGNYEYSYSPARRLVWWYEQLGRKADAKKLNLRFATTEQTDPGYGGGASRTWAASA